MLVLLVARRPPPPRRRRRCRPLLSLPSGPPTPYALTDDGTLLAQTLGTLSSYDLADGRLRWQAGPSTPTYRLRTGGGLVLMRPWTHGAGPSRAPPRSRWPPARPSGGAPATWSPSPARTALLAVSAVRSFGGSGRRVQGPVDAIDPRTGATRWTVDGAVHAPC